MYINRVKSISVYIYIVRTKGLDTVLEQNDLACCRQTKRFLMDSLYHIDIKKIHIYICIVLKEMRETFNAFIIKNKKECRGIDRDNHLPRKLETNVMKRKAQSKR